MRILFLLARQFNLLLQVKELQRLGCDQKTIASRTGLQSFVVRNYTGCTGRYTTAQLRQAVEDFTQTEEEVKTGRLSDVLSVELLIVKYARKNPGVIQKSRELSEMDSFRDFRIPAEVTTGSFLRIQSNKKEQSLTG